MPGRQEPWAWDCWDGWGPALWTALGQAGDAPKQLGGPAQHPSPPPMPELGSFLKQSLHPPPHARSLWQSWVGQK